MVDDGPSPPIFAEPTLAELIREQELHPLVDTGGILNLTAADADAMAEMVKNRIAGKVLGL